MSTKSTRFLLSSLSVLLLCSASAKADILSFSASITVPSLEPDPNGLINLGTLTVAKPGHGATVFHNQEFELLLNVFGPADQWSVPYLAVVSGVINSQQGRLTIEFGAAQNVWPGWDLDIQDIALTLPHQAIPDITQTLWGQLRKSPGLGPNEVVEPQSESLPPVLAPEPSSGVLMGSCLVLLVGAIRQARRR